MTLGIPWTQSMPSRDVLAATQLAEASFRRDKNADGKPSNRNPPPSSLKDKGERMNSKPEIEICFFTMLTVINLFWWSLYNHIYRMYRGHLARKRAIENKTGLSEDHLEWAKEYKQVQMENAMERQRKMETLSAV